MVQARLSNFVVQFLNLGMVGRCNKNIVVGAKKTASCQLEFSGGKRKRDETLNIKEGGISTLYIFKILTCKSLNCQQLSNKDVKEHIFSNRAEKRKVIFKTLLYSALSHWSVTSDCTSIAKGYYSYISSSENISRTRSK